MSYMDDKRLVGYKDFTHKSKYAGKYMTDEGFYNGMKPFVHLKLDQICRDTKPEDTNNVIYDYDLYFSEDLVTIGLDIRARSEDDIALLRIWQLKVAELIDATALAKFSPNDAYPEDIKIFNMLKELALKLKYIEIRKSEDGYFVIAAANFSK